MCVLNHNIVDYTLNNTNYSKMKKVFEDLVTLMLFGYPFMRCTNSTSTISSG